MGLALVEDLGPSVTAARLRSAMGHFATGVMVVSAVSGDGTPHGSTANAISSLSLEPPLVLVCLRRRSVTLRAMLETGRFALNILDAGQEAMANRFAHPSSGLGWVGVDHRPGLTGAPLLDAALATIEADVHQLADGGDHRIVIGRVLAVEHPAEHVPPLLFYRGTYARLDPLVGDRA
jgi:3-hydroxy-9,10-secoandrosta-1,3,5(10)-triene-9,17-dione monooxygenase reductase component